MLPALAEARLPEPAQNGRTTSAPRDSTPPVREGTFVFLSELLDRPVRGAQGERLGKLVDFLADTSEAAYPRITALRVKTSSGVSRCEWTEVASCEPSGTNLKRGAEAREKRAEVDLQDAQRQFDREQIVQQKGVGTPAALDQVIARLGTSKAALAAAHADVAAAQARVEVARVNLENCYVRAPFSGRITQKLTDIGEIVFGFTSAGTGNGGIASLADFSTLQVEADVSESQVAKLKIGTPAEIVLDAFPDKRYRGRVAEVRPRVDRAKATVTVKVAFVDDAADVLPDMGSKVTFLTKELDQAAQKAPPTPAISPDTVVDRGETKAVFTVQSDQTVRAVPVVTGPPLGNLVSLRQGPPAGTKIVRSPPAELRDGMRVKEKQ